MAVCGDRHSSASTVGDVLPQNGQQVARTGPAGSSRFGSNGHRHAGRAKNAQGLPTDEQSSKGRIAQRSWMATPCQWPVNRTIGHFEVPSGSPWRATAAGRPESVKLTAERCLAPHCCRSGVGSGSSSAERPPNRDEPRSPRSTTSLTRLHDRTPRIGFASAATRSRFRPWPTVERR